jgi:hypothetical protein
MSLPNAVNAQRNRIDEPSQLPSYASQWSCETGRQATGLIRKALSHNRKSEKQNPTSALSHRWIGDADDHFVKGDADLIASIDAIEALCLSSALKHLGGSITACAQDSTGHYPERFRAASNPVSYRVYKRRAGRGSGASIPCLYLTQPGHSATIVIAAQQLPERFVRVHPIS